MIPSLVVSVKMMSPSSLLRLYVTQPNLQSKTNCGHLTSGPANPNKVFSCPVSGPILLTALGKRHPGINPVLKYTAGARAWALEGKGSHEDSDLSAL